MADPSLSWWKVTFLRRKKSQSKVQYEMPAESVSSGAAAGPEDPGLDPQLDARLEQIVDKTAASRGRHVQVSQSGRFKEKKRVRATLSESPHMCPGEPAKDDNLKAGP